MFELEFSQKLALSFVLLFFTSCSYIHSVIRISRYELQNGETKTLKDVLQLVNMILYGCFFFANFELIIRIITNK